MCRLFVNANIQFTHRQQALEHIGKIMLEKNVVQASYPAALLAREAEYPTGIALKQHAVAIPHCEAEHSKSPAIYLLRPLSPVLFQRADDDEEIAAVIIIALIVKNPSAQLQLLRCLFNELQHPQFIEQLINEKPDRLGLLFREKILPQPYQIENL